MTTPKSFGISRTNFILYKILLKKNAEKIIISKVSGLRLQILLRNKLFLKYILKTTISNVINGGVLASVVCLENQISKTQE